MSDPLWTIHNNRTLVTVDNLTTDEALSILRAEQPTELQYWFAWRDGMASWNPVVTVVELDLNAPIIKEPKPKLPAAPPAPSAFQVFEAPDKAGATEQPNHEQTEKIDETNRLNDVPAVLSEKENDLTQSDLFQMEDSGQIAFNLSDPESRGQVEQYEIYWMSDGDGALEKADWHRSKASPEFQVLYSERGQAPVQNHLSNQNLRAQLVVNPEPAPVPTNVAQLTGGPVHQLDKDRRKYPRIDIRFKVIIQNDNITFRTYSRNASLGGLALEVAIPPILMGQNCMIHIADSLSGEVIRVPGRLVSNRDQTRFFSFFRASAESITKLQKWLSAVSQLKKVS